MYAGNGEELIKICTDKGISLAEYAILYEMENTGETREELIKRMTKNLRVMMQSAAMGMEKEVNSVTGLIGGDAYKLSEYIKKGKSLTGMTMVKAMARALSCSEVNASMGRIVAAPTAGSCGILPAVIITAGEQLDLTEEEMVMGLFTSSAVGMIIAKNATLAGAEGGCQAECGSAAAMASAAVVEMMGGTPEMALSAGAIVIKNILGLVCDPVAGLVEVPCAKRNAAGAVSALTTAEMVMAGILSRIPFDDMIEAMYRVGKALPMELRETAMGGCAITRRGIKLAKSVGMHK